MPIQPDRLVGYRLPEIAQTYAPRDAILYALGVGLGHDPCAREDLKFLVEDGLEVLPTFAVTLSSPGMWIRAPEFGVDFVKLVHSEQAAWFHAPLPPEADVVGSAEVLSLTDRGPGRGAVLVLERKIRDAAKRPRLLHIASDPAPPRRRRLRRPGGARPRRRLFPSGRRT